MTALDVFLQLTAAGCALTRQGDKVRVCDPQHVLTDEVRQAIRAHKAALLGLLTPEPLSPTYPCTVCSRTQRWDDRGIWRCMTCWPSREDT
jgi:TubC N-terminal docking domain